VDKPEFKNLCKRLFSNNRANGTDPVKKSREKNEKIFAMGLRDRPAGFADTRPLRSPEEERFVSSKSWDREPQDDGGRFSGRSTMSW
jgi:hypothetical protein